ncbi:MAG: S24/S26 family peptidase [Planctomycetota bacterium]
MPEADPAQAHRPRTQPARGADGRRSSKTRRDLLRAGMDALVESGGRVSVSGACMVPAVPAGAVVRLEPCGAGALRPGDVVLLERGGTFFLHRYLARTGSGPRRRLVVKSDRGRRADAPWPPTSVVGRLAEIGEGQAARACRPGRAARLRAAAEGLFWAHAFPFLREARDALTGRRRGGRS